MLDEYRERVARVEAACKKAVEDCDAAVIISTTLQGVQERHIAANKALAALHMEHEGIKQKVIQKDIDLAELMKRLEALKHEKDLVEEALRKEKDRVVKITQERDDTAERVRALESDVLAAETEIAELKRRIGSYDALIQQKETSMQKLNVQLEHAQDQVHSQGIELLDKQDIITELERNLRSLQRTIDSQVNT